MSTAGLEYNIGMIAFRIQELAALGTNQQGSFSYIPTGGKEPASDLGKIALEVRLLLSLKT